MTYETDFSLEVRITLLEKLVNAIALLENYSCDMGFVCGTLIQQDIKTEIRDEIPNRRNAFDCDVVKARIFFIEVVELS